MKYIFVVITLFFACSFSKTNEYIKIDLGKGFYYLGDSTSNKIYFSPSYKDTLTSAKNPKIVWVIIPEIESFGVNTTHILATNKTKQDVSYWIIDKTQQPSEMSYKERIVLSNVTMVDSAKFVALRKELDITIQPIYYYKRR